MKIIMVSSVQEEHLNQFSQLLDEQSSVVGSIDPCPSEGCLMYYLTCFSNTKFWWKKEAY